MPSAATPQQIQVLQHTLGLRPHIRVPHRNHFVASPGHHEMGVLEALETLGFMERVRTPSFCAKDDIVFVATDAGRTLALENLQPEPQRTRYEDFLSYDGCLSFGEYLCGAKQPSFERRSLRWDQGEWRMARYDHGVVDIAGEWCRTKKDAKASYKKALAAHAASQKASRHALPCC